jgi:hypothetical protein
MIIGTFIETISTSVSRVCKHYDSSEKVSYSQLEWKALPTLQLQRQVHEALDMGLWHGTHNDNPTTCSQVLVGVLDEGNPEHPRFVHPFAAGENDDLKEHVGVGKANERTTIVNEDRSEQQYSRVNTEVDDQSFDQGHSRR